MRIRHNAVALFIGFFLGTALLGNLVDWVFFTLRKDSYECTASRVVKESLPRVEECTQYTRKQPANAGGE